MPRHRTAATLCTVTLAALRDDEARLKIAPLIGDDIAARTEALLAPVLSGEVEDPSDPNGDRDHGESPASREGHEPRAYWSQGPYAAFSTHGQGVVRVEVSVDIDRLPGDQGYHDDLVDAAAWAAEEFIRRLPDGVPPDPTAPEDD